MTSGMTCCKISPVLHHNFLQRKALTELITWLTFTRLITWECAESANDAVPHRNPTRRNYFRKWRLTVVQNGLPCSSEKGTTMPRSCASDGSWWAGSTDAQIFTFDPHEALSRWNDAFIGEYTGINRKLHQFELGKSAISGSCIKPMVHKFNALLTYHFLFS